MRKLKGISYRILIFVIVLVGTLAFGAPVSAIELAYDDGSCTSMYMIHGPSEGPQIVRQKFLLSDFGLTGDYMVGKEIKVRIYWGLGSSGTDFTGVIRLWEPDVMDLTQSFVNPPHSAWQDFDFSGMGFSSSEFYVEVLWTSGWGYVCEEQNLAEPVHNMAETDSGTGTWYLWPYDMGIRVEVRERPLGALPATQCLNLVELLNPTTGAIEKFSARVRNDFDGCIVEDSATFYKSSDCTGTAIQPTWQDPDPNLVYKSGTMGGCAEAVEVTSSSPVCVELTLKSGRKTTVCY